MGKARSVRRILYLRRFVTIAAALGLACADGLTEIDARPPPPVDAAALGLACADGLTEIDARPPPPVDAAAGEKTVPASQPAAPTGSGRAASLYRRLRATAPNSSGESVLVIDERLKAAESEFPLEFRFSYERATLAVFGRHDHHEAFRRLRRAAEKAIETGRSEAMLEMLAKDGAPSGPLWKLARGHSEWRRILAALERSDRDALWHADPRAEAGAVPEAHSEIPPETHSEAHSEAEAPAASGTAAVANALKRLRLLRARMGNGEPALIQQGVGSTVPREDHSVRFGSHLQ